MAECVYYIVAEQDEVKHSTQRLVNTNRAAKNNRVVATNRNAISFQVHDPNTINIADNGSNRDEVTTNKIEVFD